MKIKELLLCALEAEPINPEAVSAPGQQVAQAVIKPITPDMANKLRTADQLRGENSGPNSPSQDYYRRKINNPTIPLK